MSSLSNKIDFAIIFSVKNANPNGDPLNGNRPRTDYDGYGEITDVCLKRKTRDRLQDAGHAIFVQSDEKKTDAYPSLRARAEGVLGKDALNAKKTAPENAARLACDTWFDVRAFGQLFAFKSEEKDGVSIPIRGPVSIHSAFSVEPVSITSTQITKSVSGDGDGSKKGSDTMGMKHRVDQAVYVTYGAISPQLAEKTGFSDQDAEVLKQILPKLFEGDASTARPEGSMVVEKVIWWQHSNKSGQYSSAKVHRTLTVKTDGSYRLDNLEDLTAEEIEGF
ncbi:MULTISPECIES: type I-C CRISPR-associated protein Cas7/Csd2 [unclassified Halomonas]|uniref:type I-C CRISPR-associated protein Cas7/Csd2 n=1 Tax=unclassified Halomonas TaxID=2609666 RepID=UPI0009908A7E|nr:MULTISPECIES: type I-C CRISPR-associated protein Cas7/Csd2 [unclassified Halomonas]AQU84716.1 type I-C CRISPR-associated protein Cas7/Csd2 [Halomonas sp. 'Soap Lake \